MAFVVLIIHYLLVLLEICIFVDIILSFFMSPFHPVRSFLDRIVQPLLAPIRRVMPSTGMFDFSPTVLLIIIWILDSFLVNLVR